MKPLKTLSPKHEKFVAAYLKSGNATEAAIHAGYSKPNARKQASVLLQRPDISGRIEIHMAEAAKEAGMTAVEVLNSLADLARNAPRERDRIRALELLGKRLKLWQDDSDIQKRNETPTINLTLVQTSEKNSMAMDV